MTLPSMPILKNIIPAMIHSILLLTPNIVLSVTLTDTQGSTQYNIIFILRPILPLTIIVNKVVVIHICHGVSSDVCIGVG